MTEAHLWLTLELLVRAAPWAMGLGLVLGLLQYEWRLR